MTRDQILSSSFVKSNAALEVIGINSMQAAVMIAVIRKSTKMEHVRMGEIAGEIEDADANKDRQMCKTIFFVRQLEDMGFLKTKAAKSKVKGEVKAPHSVKITEDGMKAMQEAIRLGGGRNE